MSDTLTTLLLKRRSCRRFKNDAVDPQKTEKLLQAAQLAPSGKNTRPWEFIVIQDRQTLQKLGNCRTPNQPFLPDAPLAIAVLADTAKTDTWIEDASIAAAFIQLQAEAMSLGSCWVQIRMRESNQNMSSEAYVKDLLHIPEHLAVLCIIAAGYPDESLPCHVYEEIDPDKIHTETF